MVRDRVLLDRHTIVKKAYTPYADSLPPAKIAALVRRVHHAKTLTALLTVATDCAENYVSPHFWAIGMVAQSPGEVASLARLAQTPSLSTICEIGFNAGHSSLLWLQHAPRAQLHSFDLYGMPFSPASRSFISAAFPGRVTYHAGDSKKTVAEYARSVAAGAAPPCDLWFVDGDHGGETPRLDFRNAMAAAKPGAIVVADDVTVGWSAVKRSWEELVAGGRLSNATCDEEILCAKGRRKPKQKGLGKWIEDTGPLRSCFKTATPPCLPANDATTRCFKKRWCVGRVAHVSR